MKKKLGLVVLLVTTLTSYAQKDNENSLKDVPFKERIVVGGGLGMSFGSNQDFISLSPMLGYKVTERFMVGSSVTYRYTKYKTNPPFKLTDYGVNPFLRYTIFENVFLQTEFEYLNYEFPLADGSTTRKDFNSFLAGGGFMQPIGDRAVFFLMALYNFSYKQQDYYTPYDSPLILRGGISFGF